MDNWYRNVIEALGMAGSRHPIRNKLNKAKAQSTDPKLRKLVAEVISSLDASNTNTDHTPVAKMKSVDTGELEQYCEANAYKAK